jgi:hypothetical protein
MFYVLYLFVAYLLTLPRMCRMSWLLLDQKPDRRVNSGSSVAAKLIMKKVRVVCGVAARSVASLTNVPQKL